MGDLSPYGDLPPYGDLSPYGDLPPCGVPFGFGMQWNGSMVCNVTLMKNIVSKTPLVLKNWSMVKCDMRITVAKTMMEAMTNRRPGNNNNFRANTNAGEVVPAIHAMRTTSMSNASKAVVSMMVLTG